MLLYGVDLYLSVGDEEHLLLVVGGQAGKEILNALSDNAGPGRNKAEEMSLKSN